MAANNPKYLSFDHIYTETVTITNPAAKATGVAAYRFVKRDGGYPVAGGYAAGATIYTRYGLGAFQPFGVDNTVNTTGLTVGAGVLTSTANSTTVTLSVQDDALVAARTALGSGAVSIYILVNGQPTSIGTVSTYASGTSVTLGAGVNASYARTAVPYFFGPAVGEGYQFPNATTTPLNPNVFKYQGFLSVVTNGIAILEVDSTSTFAVDDAVYSTTSGTASSTAGAGVVLGRALDAVTVAGPGQFIRVKLGGTAN